MKKISQSRGMLLASLLLAGGAVHAFDPVSSGPPMQTWYFPDGSNHTVMLTPRADVVAGEPDTRVLGAGPAPAAPVAVEEPGHDLADVRLQTWFFPDGSNHTLVMPVDPSATASAG